ncbi:MAG TPA: septal ring lytic transglycosylase RlpA family protein [Candidatus Binatia bacterium]|nr:septal ring lytic transglycosylase RlpA family protein [Candidatus Binatia bacterium]
MQSLIPQLSAGRVYGLIVLAGLSLTSQSCGIISDRRALSTGVVSPPPSETSKSSTEEPKPGKIPPVAKIPSHLDPSYPPLTAKPPSPRRPSVIETGMASWYGPGFHGKTTASGEVFNQEKFTAAHPSLPWGSTVKVTNLANGKSVEVRINDRGPFAKGRIIDVSRAAARALGMMGSGVATVEVEWLSGFERSAELASERK